MTADFFVILLSHMNTDFQLVLSSPADANVRSILEWLALAHGRTGSEDADQLHALFLLLRETAVPPGQRLKLLDLLYSQAERVVTKEIPHLKDVTLPISRRLRLRVRVVQDVLKTLAQDYFNTLAELFDPTGPRTQQTPHTSLRRAMQAIAWQLNINYLLSAPSQPGQWQQLHAAYLAAERLGIQHLSGPNGMISIAQLYSRILLAAIAQPASFSSRELEFIWSYAATHTSTLEFSDTPSLESTGLYWIDPERDFPAYALIRRVPPENIRTLYFACDEIAARAKQYYDALTKGACARDLALPAFADTHAGQAILLRLFRHWGHPVKRKFPRRKQSYRVDLCLGLESLWKTLRQEDDHGLNGEWMVTNESPDGYAVMHMSGPAQNIRVGEIVALRHIEAQESKRGDWHICIIRWALSENPEHLELGLELLSTHAEAVEIVRSDNKLIGKAPGLFLPATPPLRPCSGLLAPNGLIAESAHWIVLLYEGRQLKLQEFKVCEMQEQTSDIEFFSIAHAD